MDTEQLKKLVIDALEDIKGTDITVIDVRDKSSVTDLMVVASGTSSRQVKSLANHVFEKAREAGVIPVGIEGQESSEWVLVDLGDVVVHVMQPQIRDFYNLEKLWEVSSPKEAMKEIENK